MKPKTTKPGTLSATRGRLYRPASTIPGVKETSKSTLNLVCYYLANGLNYNEIAKEINFHPVTIRRIKLFLKKCFYENKVSRTENLNDLTEGDDVYKNA